VSTATSSPPARRQPGRSFAGLVWALVPVLLVLVFLVWWQRGEARPVQTVDPRPDVSYAHRVAPVPLPGPGPLPAGWRATSSRVDTPSGEGRSPVTLDLGYLTAGDRFARLVVSDAAMPTVLQERVPGATADGSTAVGSARWERYRTPRGETVLVRRVGAATVLVTGDAPDSDLAVLAASVR
jgi:cytoskeletal protein RodZ